MTSKSSEDFNRDKPQGRNRRNGGWKEDLLAQFPFKTGIAQLLTWTNNLRV
jgi:hypothetical protein